MDKENLKKDIEETAEENLAQEAAAEETVETPENETTAEAAEEEELDPLTAMARKVEALEAQLAEEKKEHLFTRAEFENYRKRTLKEKADLIKNGGERVLGELLPVIDDFERAKKAMEGADDVNAIREGVDLIYNKFVKFLEQHSVKAIESTGKDFDTDFHEAVTEFPAPSEEQKGKVIDTVQTGYTINDKVLRFAKVVVGR